jgi:hypothetical protein
MNLPASGSFAREVTSRAYLLTKNLLFREQVKGIEDYQLHNGFTRRNTVF